MPKTRHNTERQALARALRKHFDDAAVGKMLGLPTNSVRHLVNHTFKELLPHNSELRLAHSIGAIFEGALAAGDRAIISALREAADALEHGAPINPDEL